MSALNDQLQQDLNLHVLIDVFHLIEDINRRLKQKISAEKRISLLKEKERLILKSLNLLQ